MKSYQRNAWVDRSMNRDSTLAVGDSSRRAKELEIERAWLERARVDREAFAYFYNKYWARIFRQIYSMTKDIDVADDLTQETFLRAFVMLESFTWRGCTIGAWLVNVSRNLVLDELRRRKVRREIWFDLDLHDDADVARPDIEAERMDEDRILCDCLDRLGAGQMQVLSCRYNLGQTIRETAVAIGISESAVKSRLQRGRKQLRVLMIESGITS